MANEWITAKNGVADHSWPRLTMLDHWSTSAIGCNSSLFHVCLTLIDRNMANGWITAKNSAADHSWPRLTMLDHWSALTTGCNWSLFHACLTQMHRNTINAWITAKNCVYDHSWQRVTFRMVALGLWHPMCMLKDGCWSSVVKDSQWWTVTLFAYTTLAVIRLLCRILRG